MDELEGANFNMDVEEEFKDLIEEENSQVDVEKSFREDNKSNQEES